MSANRNTRLNTAHHPGCEDINQSCVAKIAIIQDILQFLTKTSIHGDVKG